ncbi:LysR family transcriptional regulator [Roseovarius nitratireducens]|uniref:LysR family transcriptional regulator n=1 Tax=Roseovarius nitratireducens TaxID=2044597 RepID=UPI000CE1EC80|nr:LysR family transcriptional regulator [Roseovarius nitratireducens]
MRELDWDQLRIFLAVHRGRSVRAAAQLLRVSHSTVSRRLTELETGLGARLFNRGPDGFVLTAVGEAALPRAERAETEILGLQRDIFGQDARLSGTVRITMPPVFAERLIMPHLAEFAARYPDVRLEIIPTYALSDLSRRDADIAVRFQEKPDQYLFGRRLPRFADAIYAAPEYVAAHRFDGEAPTATWLGWGDSEDLPAWVADTPFPRCRVWHDCADPLAQVEAAKAGMGMAVLPCLIGDPEPGLVRVMGQPPYKGRQGWVLTHPDLKTTERVRFCVRFICEAVDRHADLVTGEQVGAA